MASVKTCTIEVLEEGKGRKPQAGEKVTVECTGFGKNGDLSQKFWSTKDSKPFSFEIGVGGVIKAWDQGVMQMKLGERSMITASPEYGYGARGFPEWGIGPNSVLKFEIKVLKISKPHTGKVRASHILVKHCKSRRLASWKDQNGDEIKRRSVEEAGNILKGYLKDINSASDKKATFAAIASKNSDCSSAKRGGDLGAFGPGQMQTAFEDATYELAVGEITQYIVQSQSGSHLIMRTG